MGGGGRGGEEGCWGGGRTSVNIYRNPFHWIGLVDPAPCHAISALSWNSRTARSNPCCGKKIVYVKLFKSASVNNRNRPHKWSVILTQSSAVPMFLRSIGLFQPVKPNLVRNRTKLCNIHRLWSRAGHSGRMLTRISSLSTHWRDRCKLSFVFCQRKWKAICIRYHSWYISII